MPLKLRVWLPGAKRARIIPTFEFDLAPRHAMLNNELFARLIARAKTP